MRGNIAFLKSEVSLRATTVAGFCVTPLFRSAVPFTFVLEQCKEDFKCDCVSYEDEIKLVLYTASRRDDDYSKWGGLVTESHIYGFAAKLITLWCVIFIQL